MIWRRQSVRSTPIDTIVGQHTRIQGRLSGSGGIIRIEGHVEGDVETDGMAVLGEGGRVEGDIRAHDVVIGGRLIGNVTAPGHLELLPTGHLEGTVLVGAIIIGDGAVFDGVCHIVGASGPALPAPEVELPAPPVGPGDRAVIADAAAEPPEMPPRQPPQPSEHDVAKPLFQDGSAERPGTPRPPFTVSGAATADGTATAVETEPSQSSPWIPEALARARNAGPQAATVTESGDLDPPAPGAAEDGRPPASRANGARVLYPIDAETAAMLAEMEDGRPGFPLMPPLEGTPSGRPAQGDRQAGSGRERRDPGEPA